MHPADLTVVRLHGLLDQAEPPCLTIAMPLEPAGGTSQQTRIRLKNLTARAERALEARQVPRRHIAHLLADIRELVVTGVPAEHGDAGLVILRAKNLFEHVATRYALQDAVLAADRFYIKPLLPLIHDNEHVRFHVLALAQNQVRFYEGDRYGLKPVPVPGLPASAAEALRHDDRANPLQFHTGAAENGHGGTGERSAIFHGHALGSEEQKEAAFRFCELVENAVTRYLNNGRTPLLIAAAEPLDALYRQTNQYAALHDGAVRGNPEPWTEKELHQRAWEALRRPFENAAEPHAARLAEAVAKKRGATDVTSALPAALVARVDTLLVSLERDQWGRCDPQSQRIELASGPAPDAEELTSWTAIETLRHGGTVLTVPPDVLPDGATVGAIYRFPVT